MFCGPIPSTQARTGNASSGNRAVLFEEDRTTRHLTGKIKVTHMIQVTGDRRKNASVR